jgi:hypothetical protein
MDIQQNQTSSILVDGNDTKLKCESGKSDSFIFPALQTDDKIENEQHLKLLLAVSYNYNGEVKQETQEIETTLTHLIIDTENKAVYLMMGADKTKVTTASRTMYI